MYKIVLSLVLSALFISISVQSREIIPLNDDWMFFPSRVESLVPGDGAERVSLPHTWNAADFMDDGGYREGYGTYFKEINPPEDSHGKRVFLKFEGVASTAEVFFNGKKIGDHRGAYTAFTLEVTPLLKWGKANVLKVVCNNEFNPDVAPYGIDGGFDMCGGLYRKVWMVVTGEECISPLVHGSSGVFISQPVVNESLAELDAEVRVSSQGNCEVAFNLLDAKGKIVAENTAPVNGDLARCHVRIRKPHLWNGKEDPYLYKAVTILRKDGKEIDRVEENIGLRYFSLDPDKGFFLNGKHLKLHGVCRHQERAGVGTALTEEDHLADCDLFDEIGANALRLTHYPQAEFLLQEADRRGYVVWEEIPFVGVHVASESFEDNLKVQLREMILQNFNHPSICFWGLQNEIQSDIDTLISGLNALAHKMDPKRPTVSASDREHAFMHIPDAVCWNKYYGWYYGTTAGFGPFLDDYHKKYPQDCLGISEYGAGASPRQHVSSFSSKDEDAQTARAAAKGRFHPEEKQTYIHYNDWKAMAERDFVWCSFVWIMFDFGSTAYREGDTNNLNDKGLVTQDRKIRKDAFYFYKANWNKAESTLHLCSKRYVERSEDVTDIVVFSTSPKVKLYLNGKLVGTKNTDDLATVRWEEVKLAPGENVVKVKSASGEDSAVWHVK